MYKNGNKYQSSIPVKCSKVLLWAKHFDSTLRKTFSRIRNRQFWCQRLRTVHQILRRHQFWVVILFPWGLSSNDDVKISIYCTPYKKPWHQLLMYNVPEREILKSGLCAFIVFFELYLPYLESHTWQFAWCRSHWWIVMRSQQGQLSQALVYYTHQGNFLNKICILSCRNSSPNNVQN